MQLDQSASSAVARDDAAAAAVVQVTGLRDAVANRVSLDAADGCSYRVVLDYGVLSPGVAACLMVRGNPD